MLLNLLMTTFTISLPDQQARALDEERHRSGFATRSEFIRALIRKYFTEEVKFEVFTPRPLEEIQKTMGATGAYNKKFIRSVVKGLSKSSVYAR